MSDKKEFYTMPFDYELKEDDGKEGFFKGLGSPFGGKPDSYGDVVVAGAFTKTIKNGGRNGNGIAMLWMHDTHRPIGVYPELAEEKKGLIVAGQLAVKATDGKDMHELMKIKAVQGLSIGYETLEYEMDNKKKIRYLIEIALWEISPVTFPAATSATITSVKEAVESAKTERELEHALREQGLSSKAAMYIVSLCKDNLFKPQIKDSGMGKILESLHNVRSEIEQIEGKKII